MNRHQRRAQDAFLRKSAEVAKPKTNRSTQLAAFYKAQSIDRNVQGILKRAAPRRFWLLNKVKSHAFSRLFGFKVAVANGNVYSVFIGGQKVGTFNA